MPDFTKRSYKKELLDRNDIPFNDIRRNMQELDFINTWLGGHDITLAGIQKLLPGNVGHSRQPLVICETGCGGGDNLIAISRWCKKRHIDASFIGIDINPDCIEVARSRSLPHSWWIVSDYKDVYFEQRPDILFSSLFCHHFNEDDLVTMLRWMHDNSEEGFFINDLHRHPLAYYSIRWLTAIFSRSYLVKNDAPLSVLRGFSRNEWEALLHRAGIPSFSLQWKWAFRWLVAVSKKPFA